jgi:hypothetical protein
MFVTTKSVDEAHYLAAVLNSKPASIAIAGYVVDNHISTHPCENIILPKFNKGSPLHKSLVGLSKRAHAARADGDAGALSVAESAIDGAVNGLWNSPAAV